MHRILCRRWDHFHLAQWTILCSVSKHVIELNWSRNCYISDYNSKSKPEMTRLHVMILFLMIRVNTCFKFFRTMELRYRQELMSVYRIKEKVITEKSKLMKQSKSNRHVLCKYILGSITISFVSKICYNCDKCFFLPF